MEWEGIRYFKKEEFRPPGFVGDFSMGSGFLLKLDLLRGQAGSPLVVHPNGGFALTGHSENSLHYQGLAADFHICRPGSPEPRDVVDQALLAYKWSFLSIGIYPWWNHPGLHLDDRTAIGLPKAVWFRDPEDEYHIYPYGDFHRCLSDLLGCLREVRC